MLEIGHPHSWEVDHAGEHLSADFRRRYMPEGGRLVVTPQMRQLTTGIPSALDRGAAIAVSGPIGAGKSTMLEALSAVSDVNTATANITGKVTERAQWEEITTSITGEPASGSARELQMAAKEYLTAVPTLLIVDEAQFIGRPAMLQLRWLWGHNFPRFAIVLAGSDLFAHLDKEPSVASRIDRRLALRHHSCDHMLKLIREHHPQARNSDVHVLTQIDDAYAHGSWRNWSHIFLCLVNDLRYTGPITYDLAAEAIRTITGIQPALARAGATP